MTVTSAEVHVDETAVMEPASKRKSNTKELQWEIQRHKDVHQYDKKRWQETFLSKEKEIQDVKLQYRRLEEDLKDAHKSIANLQEELVNQKKSFALAKKTEAGLQLKIIHLSDANQAAAARERKLENDMADQAQVHEDIIASMERQHKSNVDRQKEEYEQKCQRLEAEKMANRKLKSREALLLADLRNVESEKSNLKKALDATHRGWNRDVRVYNEVINIVGTKLKKLRLLHKCEMCYRDYKVMQLGTLERKFNQTSGDNERMRSTIACLTKENEKLEELVTQTTVKCDHLTTEVDKLTKKFDFTTEILEKERGEQHVAEKLAAKIASKAQHQKEMIKDLKKMVDIRYQSEAKLLDELTQKKIYINRMKADLDAAMPLLDSHTELRQKLQTLREIYLEGKVEPLLKMHPWVEDDYKMQLKGFRMYGMHFRYINEKLNLALKRKALQDRKKHGETMNTLNELTLITNTQRVELVRLQNELQKMTEELQQVKTAKKVASLTQKKESSKAVAPTGVDIDDVKSVFDQTFLTIRNVTPQETGKQDVRV